MRAASRQLPAPDLWPDCHYVSVCAALAGGVTQDGDRSWDGVRRMEWGQRMQSSASGNAMSMQPTAVFAPPQHAVGLSPTQGLSPPAGMDMASLFGRESSAVCIHTWNSGWSQGREDLWCPFWVTCEVLHETRLMVWP